MEECVDYRFRNATVVEFESGFAGIPAVRHAERLFGDPDYHIRVATADLEAYKALRATSGCHPPGRPPAHFDDRDETRRRRTSDPR
jgi:hypothetical protein